MASNIYFDCDEIIIVNAIEFCQIKMRATRKKIVLLFIIDCSRIWSVEFWGSAHNRYATNKVPKKKKTLITQMNEITIVGFIYQSNSYLLD